jgi:hypothetical protein
VTGVQTCALPILPDEISNGEGGTPPGLLNGFADEIEAERASLGKKGAKNKVPDEDSGMDFPEQGFGDPDISNLGISTEDTESDGTESQDMGLPDFDLGSLEPSAEETGTGTETGDTDTGLGMEDFPDFDSGESMEMFGEEGIAAEEPLQDISDFGTAMEPEGTEPEPFDIPLPDDFSGTEAEETSDGFGDAGSDLSGFDLGDIPDFGGGESEGEPASEDTGALDLSGLDLGDISDFDGGESPAAPDMEPFPFETADTEGDDDGFDLGGELPEAGVEATLEELPGDSFDSFSPESASLDNGFDMGGGDEFGSLEDFGIPGLDLGFDAKVPQKSKTPV